MSRTRGRLRPQGMNDMHTVTSADGTRIAYERLGDGEPLIVVGGALCDANVTRSLASALAAHFTVINYDRRGRGASGDGAAYAPGREIADLEALIAAVGGRASVYGHSSGAALVLQAAAQGLPAEKVVLHEPPFRPRGEQAADDLTARVPDLLAEGRRADAVAAHLTATGIPAEVVAGMRREPWWAGMEANAPTLLYDYEVLRDAARDGRTPAGLARAVSAPTLVLCGGASQAWMLDAARELAAAAPAGRLLVLDGQGHVVPPEILVPALTEWLAAEQAPTP